MPPTLQASRASVGTPSTKLTAAAILRASSAERACAMRRPSELKIARSALAQGLTAKASIGLSSRKTGASWAPAGLSSPRPQGHGFRIALWRPESQPAPTWREDCSLHGPEDL